MQYLHLLIVDLEVDCQGQHNLRSNMEMAISQEVIAQGSNELVGRGLHSLGAFLVNDDIDLKTTLH